MRSEIADYEHTAFAAEVFAGMRKSCAERLTLSEYNKARRRVLQAYIRWLDAGCPDDPDPADYLNDEDPGPKPGVTPTSSAVDGG